LSFLVCLSLTFSACLPACLPASPSSATVAFLLFPKTESCSAHCVGIRTSTCCGPHHEHEILLFFTRRSLVAPGADASSKNERSLIFCIKSFDQAGRQAILREQLKK
ncbi:uncharacterized protein CLUP02_03086, partial [Colletotrichum lupini]